jgi:hypothetical protein
MKDAFVKVRDLKKTTSLHCQQMHTLTLLIIFKTNLLLKRLFLWLEVAIGNMVLADKAQFVDLVWNESYYKCYALACPKLFDPKM